MHPIAICSIALIIFAVLPAARYSAAQSVSRTASADEVRILNLINRERARLSLTDLAWSDDLADLARSYSERMAREHYFEHIDSSGNDVAARARKMRIRGWSRIGENLFMCSPDGNFTALSVRGWMKSQTHRENILDPDWSETGIGIAYARNGDIYITEIFANR
jgi:uncharacterized protein YkwD